MAITVTATVEADPQIQGVVLGCHNYGRSPDDAWNETAAASDKIIQAFLALDLEKKAIETQARTLDGVDFEGKGWRPRGKGRASVGSRPTIGGAWNAQVVASAVPGSPAPNQKL